MSREARVVDYGKPAARARFLPAKVDFWIGVALVVVLALFSILYATGIIEGGT